MKNKNLILLVISLTGALLIAGAALVWAPVCGSMLTLESGKEVHMKCFYTGLVSVQLAFLMAIAAVVAYMSRQDGRKVQWIVVSIGLLLILNTLQTPASIGICMMPMDCHQTAFWIRAGAALGILSALAGIFIPDSPYLRVKE